MSKNSNRNRSRRSGKPSGLPPIDRVQLQASRRGVLRPGYRPLAAVLRQWNADHPDDPLFLGKRFN